MVISPMSPLGQELMGKELGDDINVDTERMIRSYVVKAIV